MIPQIDAMWNGLRFILTRFIVTKKNSNSYSDEQPIRMREP